MNYLTPESSNEPEEYVPNEADIENIIVQNVIEEAIDFDFNQGVISSQVLQGVLGYYLRILYPLGIILLRKSYNARTS